MMYLPDPVQFGYEKDNENKLQLSLMIQDVSASELLNDFACECLESACSSMECVANEQSCTAACGSAAALPGIIDTALWCTKPFTLEALGRDDDSDKD